MTIRPEDEAALAAAVADAAASGQSLAIRGGATRSGLGHTVDGTPLETTGLTGITLYEPGALTVVAKAGTPVAEIKAALEAESQMLAFEPMDHRAIYGTTGTPTIGGVVAGNVSGPRRIQGGACRDSLLGLRFVDGRGTVIKNGGRVMKNVTGYDLAKLLAGAYGTLGVISEVSLKVLPKPEATATLMLHGLFHDDACAAMRSAMSSPFDVSGAAHHPAEIAGTPVTMIRVEGFEASVSYRVEQLKTRLADFGAEMSVSTDPALWDGVRDVTDMPQTGCLWRVSVKPTTAPTLIGDLAQSLAFRVQYDWAGGLIWLHCSDEDLARVELGASPSDPDLTEAAISMHETLRTFVATGGGGDVTLMRAPAPVKAAVSVFQPEAAPVARISAGLRAEFDPNGILNPGLFGAHR